MQVCVFGIPNRKIFSESSQFSLKEIENSINSTSFLSNNTGTPRPLFPQITIRLNDWHKILSDSLKARSNSLDEDDL